VLVATTLSCDAFLFALLCKTLLSLLACLSILAFKFVSHYTFLLVLLLFELLLLCHDSTFDLNVLKLLNPGDLFKLLRQVVHKSTDILVWSQLTPIANCDSAQGALLLALSIIRLNTVRTEPMEAALIYDWILNHLLADRTSEVLHNSTDEVRRDHIVKG
jgi:hypothetical protein